MAIINVLKNKIILPIILIIIIVFGSLFLFKKKDKFKKASFKTEKPYQKDLVHYVNATGTLQAKDQITVGSLVAGKVEKIIADDNDVVKKDDVLTILDNGIGDSSVKKLKALLFEAKSHLQYQQNFYERQKQLYESNQISKDLFEQFQQNYDVAKAKVLQTEAELELKTKEYENLFIKSPDDGIVIARKVDLGQMITSQFQATTLYVIAKDLKKMEASVAVDEADIGFVKDDQQAYFTVDAFPKEVFKAKVKQIQFLAKVIDNVVTYATLLDVDNPELKLRPGMTTDVNIKVQEAKNALVVHNKALRLDEQSIERTAQILGHGFEKLSEIKEVKDKIAQKEIDTLWIFESNSFKQIKVKTGVVEGKYTQIVRSIDKDTNVITEVTDFGNKLAILEQIFSGPGGGIGK